LVDGINALWYTGEAIYYGVTGNHELAQQSLKYSIASFVCAIPAIGSFVGQGMKLTIKGVDVGATIVRGSRLVGYGTSSVMAGYGAGNGAMSMYRKYAINGERTGWHTVGEGGLVAYQTGMSALSGTFASSAVKPMVTTSVTTGYIRTPSPGDSDFIGPLLRSQSRL